MQHIYKIASIVVLHVIFCIHISAQEDAQHRVYEILNYLQDKTEWDIADSALYDLAQFGVYSMRGQEDSAIYFLVDAEILSAKLPEPNNLIILREVYHGYSGLCNEDNEALYWLLKSKELYQQLDDIYSHPYATLIAHIANTYEEVGDIKKAKEYADVYMSLYKLFFFDEDSEGIATELYLIARCYKSAEEYESAISCANTAITMMRKALGETHPYYANYIRFLSHCYADQHKLSDAEALLSYAIEILSKNGAEYKCQLTNWNIELSNYIFENGVNSSDEDEIKEAVDLLLSVAPQNIECYGGSALLMMKIARACWVTNNEDDIFTFINRSFQIQKHETLISLGQTYSKYKSEIIPSILYQKIYEYVIDSSQNAQMDSLAYEVSIFNKGLLLNSERILQQSILNTQDSIISKKYERLSELRKHQNSSTGISHNTYLNEEIILLEHEIISELSESHNSALHAITYNGVPQIQINLSQKDLAVEFVKVKLKGEALIPQGEEKYIALILRKNWDAPKCVILGNEAELDSMPYPKLQQTVWQAIIDSAQIKEGENIYFAPDGIFYNMPIEYLPTADGRNMSDKYNMYRVSSTRELCYRDTANTYSTAVLYGGLRYDATPPNLFAQNSSMRGWDESIHESVFSQWRADDRAKYNYLPYTLKEVDSISQTIGNAIQVTTYTDKEGSEESFKALSGNSPSILHIATHGYYITPTKAEMMSKENLYRYGLTAMDDRPSVIDYSMERTGLLMAGAQLKLWGDSVPQMAEDGILSAKEISHLDLSNTDLVVLSACQTALGDITNDGVAGLQRGFKIAGVKSVLMSLWKVDDAATYLLMKQFYKSLFAGKNKQQALRDAQNYLRSYMVGNEHPYNDIHYWGAFVLLDAIEK